MSSDKDSRRREIEDTTAARLAAIVEAAERAAKQVIDEAEADARARLAGAEEEAERIVADRLAELAELAAEVDTQAEALKRGADSLQRALAELRAEVGGPESLGGSTAMRGGGASAAARRASSPSLTVVGGAPEGTVEPIVREAPAAEVSGPPVGLDRRGDRALDGWATPASTGDRCSGGEGNPGPTGDRSSSGGAMPGSHGDRSSDARATPGPIGDAPSNGDATRAEFGAARPDNGAAPAGARLLATQMAVSGSSRAEIEARLRNGFAIEDTTPILDAILGPEK